MFSQKTEAASAQGTGTRLRDGPGIERRLVTVDYEGVLEAGTTWNDEKIL